MTRLTHPMLAAIATNPPYVVGASGKGQYAKHVISIGFNIISGWGSLGRCQSVRDPRVRKGDYLTRPIEKFHLSVQKRIF